MVEFREFSVEYRNDLLDFINKDNIKVVSLMQNNFNSYHLFYEEIKISESENIVKKSELDIMKKFFDDMGIEYTIREQTSECEKSIYHYIIIGTSTLGNGEILKPAISNLEAVLLNFHYYEFENYKLVGY